VIGPDRRSLGEEMVETRTIAGSEATNRAGAAERLGMAPATIAVYSSPGQRRRYGFPDPLPDRIDGQDWFLLTDLDQYAQTRVSEVPKVRKPHELIDLAELAQLRGIKLDTAKRYLKDSRVAWAQDRDGYLPRPDTVEPGPRGGEVPRWRRSRAAEWAFPATRRTRGRQPGRRPQPADLRELRANHPGRTLTVAEEAALLSAELEVEVSPQVIRRLRRRIAADA
jgi:hypothetical protein